MVTLAWEVVIDEQADCGESPAWDRLTNQLVWVDQYAGAVHRYDPATRICRALDVGLPVGAVAPRDRGGLVLALADGFWLLGSEGEPLERIAAVEADELDHMMNDGKCDIAGRFWAGTMAIEQRLPDGSLYRLDPNGEVTRVLSGVTVSNGLGWSPDGRTFYYIDSRTQCVDAFSHDPETGALRDRRPIIRVTPQEGTPDGLAVDAEGSLWVALWDGHAIRRYSADGRLLAHVDLPVSRVTSCAFGGRDLADLYVTSASRGLALDERARQPYAGAVFLLRPEVPGLPTGEFAG